MQASLGAWRGISRLRAVLVDNNAACARRLPRLRPAACPLALQFRLNQPAPALFSSSLISARACPTRCPLVMSGHLVEPLLWSARARAKAELDASPIWSQWKAAHTSTLSEAEACVQHRDACASIAISVLADQLLDVKGNGELEALDGRSPVLHAFTAMRHVERLEQQLMAAPEWRVFQEAHRRVQELQSEELLERRRALDQRRAAARGGPSTGAPHTQSQSAARPPPASSPPPPVQPVEPDQPSSALASASASSASTSDRAASAASSTGPHSLVVVAVPSGIIDSSNTGVVQAYSRRSAFGCHC